MLSSTLAILATDIACGYVGVGPVPSVGYQTATGTTWPVPRMVTVASSNATVDAPAPFVASAAASRTTSDVDATDAVAGERSREEAAAAVSAVSAARRGTVGIGVASTPRVRDGFEQPSAAALGPLTRLGPPPRAALGRVAVGVSAVVIVVHVLDCARATEFLSDVGC